MRALRSKKDPSPFGDNIAALLKYLEDYHEYVPGPEELEERVSRRDLEEQYQNTFDQEIGSYDYPVDIGEKVSVPQDFERNLDPKPKRDGNIHLNDIIKYLDSKRRGL